MKNACVVCVQAPEPPFSMLALWLRGKHYDDVEDVEDVEDMLGNYH